ncbi:PAS domain S-box protein [Thiospirochaeta perfilievii]|uniref:histidine kinase n=1 Tax=Thiospirochaeta perfilievii TaxID=252967 RepID=A0A5C1QA33_9SPIO|nr:PAS domain S-box protein [Thiospirochaeta perfilievii]QEN03666.1 PAS domain S-box protein [Thiospirochaeta perfilievii]
MESIYSLFRYLTPLVYWMLILLWLFIFSFYIRRIKRKKYSDTLLRTLFIILSIDSLRTLLESTYFGFWYTSLSGLLPIYIFDFLSQPQIVFFPKILNLVVSLLIIFILLKKWIPMEDKRLKKMKTNIEIYQAAFDQSPVSIVITNTNGDIQYVNKKVCSFTGYSEKELIGQNPRVLKSGELDDSFYKEVWSTITSGDTWKGTFINKKKSGEVYWEDAQISPLYQRGKITHFIATKVDITEKIKIQEQLQHKNKMDSIGKLAGGMAHDFNNVLTGIISAAQLLKSPKRNLDEKSIIYADLILKSSERATDIIKKLMIFSRKGTVTTSTIDINKILDDVVSILEGTIDKKIEILINKGATKRKFIGNYSAIESSILNICINASHAILSGGQIHINTKNISIDKNYCDSSTFDILPGEYIEIGIKDSGCGIPNDNIKKIFEPFYTTKEQGKGTGLGLFTVYSTIKDHQGSLDVQSQEGVGTIFSILLPCSDNAIEKEDKITPIFSGSSTVLVVDDEEFNRILNKDLLESLGYKVLLAKDGEESVEIFRKNHLEIDLVLMDMIMPKMSGSEAFYKMREIDENCNVVITSGNAENGMIKVLIEQGVADFISKPYKISELSKVLARNMRK